MSESVSPILLYYALAQGMQAVLAAREPGNGWRAKPSHGLSQSSLDLREDAAATLHDFTVVERGSGLFQQILGLFRSQPLQGSVSLAELVNSLPESRNFLMIDRTAPRPLHVSLDDGSQSFERAESCVVAAWVSPFPDHLVPEFATLNTFDPSELPSLVTIRDWLRQYRSFDSDRTPTVVFELIKAHHLFSPSENQILLGWNLGDGHNTYADQREFVRRLIDYPDGGTWGHGAEGAAIPALGNNPAALHPLPTWLAILYLMSMIARYHPNRWTRLLQPDSPEAERLREILEASVDAIPWHIFAQIHKDALEARL